MIELTEEQRMLKATVKRFVDEYLMPAEAEILENGSQIVGTKYDQWGGKDKYMEVQRKAKEIAGLWSLFLPQEHGGAGLSNVDFVIVYSELSKCSLPFHLGGDLPMADLLMKSDPAILNNYVKPVIESEKLWCFANTEPHAGADATGIKTRAVKKGDKWVLSGTKTWITDASIADFAFVTAVTDPNDRKGGKTLFIVDRKTVEKDGYQVVRDMWVMGGSSVAPEIFMDEVEVPESHVVGRVGGGYEAAQTFFSIRTRLEHAAINMGYCDRSLNIALDYARERETFGDNLINRQAIQRNNHG